MISTIIKELRIEKKISQSVLAKEIGVSQKAIDYWERGINEPKASYIIKLADFFDVSADYLLGRKEVWKIKQLVFYCQCSIKMKINNKNC